MAATTRVGYYGEFGGRFVAETLVPALEELERAFETHVRSAEFQREWRGLLASYVFWPLDGLVALVAGEPDPGFLHQVVGVVRVAATAHQGAAHARQGLAPVHAEECCHGSVRR